jgi:hypothetical protein
MTSGEILCLGLPPPSHPLLAVCRDEAAVLLLQRECNTTPAAETTTAYKLYVYAVSSGHQPLHQ